MGINTHGKISRGHSLRLILPRILYAHNARGLRAISSQSGEGPSPDVLCTLSLLIGTLANDRYNDNWLSPAASV